MLPRPGRAQSRRLPGPVRERQLCCRELRLTEISTIEEANRFLEETYLPRINAKFSRPPADSAPAPVPLGTADLREILCYEYRRTVSRDYVVSFQRRLFQIRPESRPLPRPLDKVMVRVRLDTSVDLYFQGKKLLIRELKKTPKKEAA
jgi:hypothetical protein